MNKIFITLSILLITTSAFSKDTKDTKKINPNICIEKNDKLFRYTVNKQFTECYNIDEKHN